MRKIFQLLLAVAIIGLIYVIYIQISTPIQFEQEMSQREKAVIERIKDVRSAQRAFKTANARFTGDFDTLINFVLNDSLTMQRKRVDEDDSVGMAQFKLAQKKDKTLKNIEEFKVAVIDTVFAPRKLTRAQVEDLRYIPGTDKQTEFIINAGLVATESKVVIPVVEVKAPYILFLDTVKYRQEIINKNDDLMNNYNKYPGIKFGSMEGGNNEAGNWTGE
ncbi:MAG: hypothetical protein R3Y44_02750 [Rikenellaceae bacterium]